MFNFLKKILKNEEQQQAKQEIEIKVHDLEDWVGEKAKPWMEDAKHKADEILMKVDEELQRTRFNIERLENAKLQNPNIPFKAKQYMEGNRKVYIRSVNSFLGHIEINNKDYHYLLEFCKEFEKMINALNKDTLRSYTILQEFFANESGKIAENLRNFDKLFNALRSALNSENLGAVNITREKAESLRAKCRQRLNIGVDLKGSEASLKLANEEKESIMAEIMNFSQSEEHNKFIDLNEKKKNKEKEFAEGQDVILQSFSVLERPLRKYSHIAFDHEEDVLKYLKEPIDTLVSDKEMRIADILKNLEKMLAENSIQIDEKKKEKTLEEIKKLNREFLKSFIGKHQSFQSEIEELDKEIKATGVSQKMKDLNKKLEEANTIIEKNKGEYERTKNDFEKANSSIESLKAEISELIKDVFSEDVKISV